MLTKKPTILREGQTLFNFLEWLGRRGYPKNENYRMADPFHLTDEELNRLFDIYVKKIQEEADIKWDVSVQEGAQDEPSMGS